MIKQISDPEQEDVLLIQDVNNIITGKGKKLIKRYSAGGIQEISLTDDEIKAFIGAEIGVPTARLYIRNKKGQIKPLYSDPLRKLLV